MGKIRRGTKGVWKRSGRPNYFAWIDGKQVNLGTPVYQKALDEWHRLNGNEAEREPDDDALVVTLINRFVANLEDEKRPDVGWYRSRCASFAESIPKLLTLAELSPRHVADWMKARAEWSPTHKAGSISAVQRALNWHVEQGNIGRNPIARIRKPKRDRRQFVYSKEQLAALLKAMPEPAKSFFTFVAATGCRPSELAAANGADVAKGGATIAVRKSKTGALNPMPVPKRLRRVLTALAKKVGERPLFASKSGGRWNRTTWGRAIIAAREAAGLPPEADAYSLRHTFVTERLKEGWSAADVALATRTSIAMISACYGHLTGERTRGLADKL
jgi:integrase